MNKEYKAVFCDIDGTLVNDDKELTEPVIEAVKKLDKKGIPFILVSGRLPAGIFKFKNPLGLNTPIIAFGGGLVLDENNEKLYERGFPRTVAEEIEAYQEELDSQSALNFYIDQDWFTNNKEHPLEIWEAQSIGVEPEQAHVKDVATPDAIVNKCLFTGEPEEIDRLNETMAEHFPELTVVKSLPILLELMPGGTKKADGIELLCERMGITPEETVVLGDNYNDKDMLELAGLPVIMDNAPESLKIDFPNAYIAPDNNHDGVAHALNDIFNLT